MPEHNLLSEPIFGARLSDRRRVKLSLPEVLAALSEDSVEAFTGFRRHQQHAWHAFLCQLGAIALHRAGADDARQTSDWWRESLRVLTDGADEPWCLVIEDLSRPAFFQPPVPEKTLAGFKGMSSEPDARALDVLVTARNHDVKASRMGRGTEEAWCAALVSLQTMQGFLGPGNYGIARMNGGFASRPVVGFALSDKPGSRWQRDLKILLTERTRIARDFGYSPTSGVSLLWLLPWDGRSSIALGACDPLFIEVCRRVRLERRPSGLVARTDGTSSTRIAAKEAKGNVGDVWIPIAPEEAKALTIGSAGFSYRTTSELLWGTTWKAPAALMLQAEERKVPLTFRAEALARGQGGTDGWHERSFEIPAAFVSLLSSPDERQRLASAAKGRIERVSEFHKKVMRPALCRLLQPTAKDKDLELGDRRVQPFIDAHDHRVDAEFFERLWTDFALGEDKAARTWESFLVESGRAEVSRASEALPIPSASRFRAIALADLAFSGAARRLFPAIHQPHPERGDA